MALCQKELGFFIQAIKSLQMAADLDPKYAVKIKKNYFFI